MIFLSCEIKAARIKSFLQTLHIHFHFLRSPNIHIFGQKYRRHARLSPFISHSYTVVMTGKESVALCCLEYFLRRIIIK